MRSPPFPGLQFLNLCFFKEIDPVGRKTGYWGICLVGTGINLNIFVVQTNTDKDGGFP